MQLPELLLKRRSIRKYIDKPIAIDVLKEIINDSLLAPSAGNEQPWKYIIPKLSDYRIRFDISFGRFVFS